jgi:TonB family protein
MALVVAYTVAACTRTTRPQPDCPTQENAPGFDIPAELISALDLALPPEERARMFGASAVLAFLVDERGAVVPCTIHIVRTTDPRLAAAARTAIRTARFRPARVNDRPTSGWVQLPFEIR